jgi:hypothetical protein
MNLWTRLCRFMAARRDAECVRYIRAGDMRSYHQCARASDRWWKLGGGVGR